MVVIAQLVRASDCGSEGRGFEPRFPPFSRERDFVLLRFVLGNHVCHIRDFFYTLRRNSEQVMAVATATFNDSDVSLPAGKLGMNNLSDTSFSISGRMP